MMSFGEIKLLDIFPGMKNIKREERPVLFDVCTLIALAKLIKQIMLFCTGPFFFGAEMLPFFYPTGHGSTLLDRQEAWLSPPAPLFWILWTWFT